MMALIVPTVHLLYLFLSSVHASNKPLGLRNFLVGSDLLIYLRVSVGKRRLNFMVPSGLKRTSLKYQSVV